MNKKHPPFHSPLNRKRAYNPGLELINPLSFSVKKLHYRRTITLLPPRLEPSRADTRCIKQFGYTRLEGAAEPRAPLSRFPWGCLIPSLFSVQATLRNAWWMDCQNFGRATGGKGRSKGEKRLEIFAHAGTKGEGV